MIRALVTGTLHNDPQARTSQNGKPFTTGKLKADASENGIAWVSLIGFQEQAFVQRLQFGINAMCAFGITGKRRISHMKHLQRCDIGRHRDGAAAAMRQGSCAALSPPGIARRER